MLEMCPFAIRIVSVVVALHACSGNQFHVQGF